MKAAEAYREVEIRSLKLAILIFGPSKKFSEKGKRLQAMSIPEIQRTKAYKRWRKEFKGNSWA